MDALTITNLRKTYEGGVDALKGISFSVKEGDFFGLLGPNGAGKTTTLGIVTSLVRKTSGTVKVFGKVVEEDWEFAKQQIGVVGQEINLSAFYRVIDTLINQAGYYGVPRGVAKVRAERLLKQLGLWEKRNTVSKRLSGGMKRRLMIAKALMHNPRLLILDEPTAGVDAELRSSTWDFLRELNKSGVTVILTTHYLEEAEAMCNRIAIIDKGEILENTTTTGLIRNLKKETFVLDLDKPLKKLPVGGKKYSVTFVESEDMSSGCQIEVTLSKKQTLNELFTYLSKQKVSVVSMRNKQNRLEQLFLGYINGGKSEAGVAVGSGDAVKKRGHKK